MIVGYLVPLIMTKRSFNMEVSAMPHSDQLYAVIISKVLVQQLQLKPDIVENTIQ